MTGFKAPEGSVRLDADLEGLPHDAHYWIVTSIYRIGPRAAERSAVNGDTLWLDRENVVAVLGPGCWKCERSWADVHDEPCSGTK